MTTGPAGGFAIGAVTMTSRLVLAPMAGVTDLPFRLLCREAGAGLVTTEMVSDLALLGKSRRSGEIIQVSPYEHPVAAQLCGSCPATVARAAGIIADCGVDMLDINMGCPAPKIVSNGEGAALMREPELAVAIIEAVRARVGRAMPVTVKIRAGWDEESVNAVRSRRPWPLRGLMRSPSTAGSGRSSTGDVPTGGSFATSNGRSTFR